MLVVLGWVLKWGWRKSGCWILSERVDSDFDYQIVATYIRKAWHGLCLLFQFKTENETETCPQVEKIYHKKNKKIAKRGELHRKRGLCCRDADAQVLSRIGVLLDSLRVLAFHWPAAWRSLPWVVPCPFSPHCTRLQSATHPTHRTPTLFLAVGKGAAGVNGCANYHSKASLWWK